MTYLGIDIGSSGLRVLLMDSKGGVIRAARHMHGAVLLDDEGAVIRPSIMWNDTRSHTQAAALDQDPGFRAGYPHLKPHPVRGTL